MNRSTSRTDSLLMLLCAGGLLAFHVALPERVPEAGGLGWDGVVYAEIVRSLPEMVEAGRLSNYYAHRVLPALVVRFLIDLRGLEFSVENIVGTFALMNAVLLLLTAFAWSGLARALGLSRQAAWLGFLWLLFTFPAAKLFHYYPPLTDPFALCLATCMLYFHTRKNDLGLVVAAVLGAATWATVPLYCAVLLAFPSGHRLEQLPERREAWIRKLSQFSSRRLVPLGIATVVLLLGGIVLLTKLNVLGPRGPLTALPNLVIFGAAALSLLSAIDFRATLSQLRPSRLIVAAAVFVIPNALLGKLANPQLVDAGSIFGLVAQTLDQPTGRFFLPLVTSFAFWGIPFLVLVLRFQDWSRALMSLGPAHTFIGATGLILMLPAEPRYPLASWPVICLSLAQALPPFPTRVQVALAALTVAVGQFWLRLNVAPWEGAAMENLLSFPKQLYFLHFGRWTSWAGIAINVGVAAASVVILRRLGVPGAGQKAAPAQR